MPHVIYIPTVGPGARAQRVVIANGGDVVVEIQQGRDALGVPRWDTALPPLIDIPGLISAVRKDALAQRPSEERLARTIASRYCAHEDCDQDAWAILRDGTPRCLEHAADVALGECSAEARGRLQRLHDPDECRPLEGEALAEARVGLDKMIARHLGAERRYCDVCSRLTRGGAAELAEFKIEAGESVCEERGGEMCVHLARAKIGDQEDLIESAIRDRENAAVLDAKEEAASLRELIAACGGVCAASLEDIDAVGDE